MTPSSPIGIIDYGMGNLYSLERALARLEAEPLRVATPAEAAECGHLILPGVGSAGPAMARLARAGWPDFLAQWTLDGNPLLGICLGFQLLFDGSEENGGTECLGLVPGRVARFEGEVKVPHMGWNEVTPRPGARLFQGITATDFYFVHSYYAADLLEPAAAATCDYGGEFVCAVEERDNPLFGAQFHPEKSGAAGARLLANYLQVQP
jgi:glutamine amidotransferase